MLNETNTTLAEDGVPGRDRVDVSVLVPVLNEAAHIRETVGAMQAQRFSGSIELLLADGRSDDGTRAILEEIAAQDPRIRVLDNPAGHIPGGLNVCLRHARGEYVARMDAHTLYPRDYLALGVQRLRRGDVAWVSGPQIPVSRGRVSRAVALALGTWMGRGGSRKWQAARLAAESGEPPGRGTDSHEEVELDSGVFAGVWRRDTLLEHGGWDERWVRNQDSEMAARFLARGERLVCVAGMGAGYFPRDSLTALAWQYLRYGIYRARTARRHPASMRRSHLFAPGLNIALCCCLGPRPIRGLARMSVGAYATCLLLTAFGIARTHRASDAALSPVVLFTMHVAHGAGFLTGFGRFGVPWRALLHVAGLKGEASMPERASGTVFAPSLHDSAR